MNECPLCNCVAAPSDITRWTIMAEFALKAAQESPGYQVHLLATYLHQAFERGRAKGAA